jgi:hypothetical protein
VSTSSPPRVALTIAEAAAAIGVSESSFRRYLLPDLRVIQAGPRLTLVRVSELDRYLEQRQALAQPDLGDLL